MFYRLVGLVFPMPDVIVFRRRDLSPRHGPEGESLLGRHIGEAGPSEGVDPAEEHEPSAKAKGKLSSSGGSDEEQGILLAGAEFELNEEELTELPVNRSSSRCLAYHMNCKMYCQGLSLALCLVPALQYGWECGGRPRGSKLLHRLLVDCNYPRALRAT